MAIEDILMGDETLFQNINAFNPDYMPENFNFRDTQMEGMAMCIRPAIQGGRPTNSVIMGSCATGKTTALKKVFELVERTSDKVVCCYINCQLHTTRFGIFSQIHKKLFGHQPPETGVPFSRVYEKVMKYLASENKALVVAFDDVNYLFQTQHANKIFYDILRAYEEFEGVRTGIFAILSDLEFRYALDKNVNTVFIPQDITFASRAITLEHVEEAVAKQGSIHLMETINSLNDIERTLLKAVVESDEILTAGELSKQFKEEANVSYATFNRTLEKLEFLRLVDTKFTGKGVRGNSREIILRFDKEDIKRCNL